MKALILDTETTKLIQNSLLPLDEQPQIIEFFGHIVDIDTNIHYQELEFYCRPSHAIPAEITKITGITDDDLRDAKPFSYHSDNVRRLIADAQAVIAHNLSYDAAVIEAEFARIGERIEWPIRRICTVQETEWMRGHRLSLSALHEEIFGQGFSGAHRARKDVEALTRCVIELRKKGFL